MTKILTISLNEQEEQQLTRLSNAYKQGRSKIIRTCINTMFENLQQEITNIERGKP